MIEWLNSLNGLETFFLACTFLGGIPLVILFVLQFFGHDVDAAHDGSIHVGDTDVSADTDVSFRFLSFQGLAAFFMFFGLVGLAMFRESGMSATWSILGGIGAGATAMWLVAKVSQFFKSLQTSGTLDSKDALNCTGEVYLTIKAGDTGKVMINFNNRLREFDAASNDKGDLPTGTRIKVIAVSGRTLVVEKIN